MNIHIRPALPQDALDISAIRRMPGVLENICGIPSEQVAVIEAMLSDTSLNNHRLVAEITLPEGDTKVVGFVGLWVNESPRVRHCGGLFLMVHVGYQHQGIGQKLMEAILNLADNWLKLERVELAVFAENTPAIGLYQKMGFVQEAYKRKAAIRLGKYADELVMARLK